ncbi:hypothetical protein BT96DRAFT_918779 [Gymnopus androsaceus JB14]|uniref:Uncharacterized protein n=1 Tax=Gymnopus androsaceus JB14 TaxID=1447944 RepID=A0A6A4HQV8_9AGAR|nr:hypothetical protein BT96DRAFT_918779 [Gymnopus androsaceus JB14]
MSLERYVGVQIQHPKERNLLPVEIVPKGMSLTLRHWVPTGYPTRIQLSNSIRILVESTVLPQSMASIKILNVTQSPVNPNSSTKYFLVLKSSEAENSVYQNF